METPNGGSRGWLWTFLSSLSLIFLGFTIKNTTDVAGLKEGQAGTQYSIQRIEKEIERVGAKLDRVLEKR